MKTKIIISFISLLILFFVCLIIFLNLDKEKKVPQKSVTVTVPAPIVENKLSIFMAGDIMLDRQVAKRINQFGINYIFASTTDAIKNAEISVANLEGVLTNFDSISAQDHTILQFTFDPSLAKILSDIGFDALSQANNHNDDFGTSGINQSYDFLKSVNIQPFGDYFNKDDRVATFDKNGFKIAFIGWNEFGGKVDRTLDLIKQIKDENYFVIVMPHWGIEYQDYPTDSQKTNARKMIDSGADMIIGSHPHVVEGIEIHQNKPIFYSLGNFVFDQNFSYGTTHAITLKITKTDSEEKINILPIQIKDSAPSFMEDIDKQKMLDFVASISDSSLKQQIQSGEIIIPKVVSD